MRKSIALVSLLTLAACGGGGPQTVSGNATPGSSPALNPSAHTFVTPTVAKTYSAIGGVQSYQYSTDDRTTPGNPGQYAQLYAGNASTARNSAITVTYDPRDAIFNIVIADSAAGVNDTLRFQDPAHRTNYGGVRQPQAGNLVPDSTNSQQLQYLQVGSSNNVRFSSQSTMVPVGDANGSIDRSTFFYQKPGTTTQYVTYAGFVRNATGIAEVTSSDGTTTYLKQNNTLERAAFVFGERTDSSAVPRTGTATYAGDMIATMVFNNTMDTTGNSDTYYQWITGSNSTTVDFANSTFTSAFTGTVQGPQLDVYSSGTHSILANATFNAAGSGRIDIVNAGGFLGQVSSASFTNPGNAATAVNIAGSSIDGTFYGPGVTTDKVEVGGGFRIVGGTPDERIDILGAFTGKKQ